MLLQGCSETISFKQYSIHTVPTLHFVHDDSVRRGFEMDQLIREAMADTPEER